ncbi:MAG: class III signal peptide-containing protein [Candidatus Woesearchaeota archaeon]|nr:MAG: class III signal peptide-containing protein [Candidatus Woesearchaeota archaeon]
MSRRGQISVEYLIIIGLSLALLIPAVMLFMNYANTSTDDVVSSQINRIGNALVDQAFSVYTFGEGSWTTLTLTFPERVDRLVINGGNELVISVFASGGVSESIFFSEVDVTTVGCSPPGPCELAIHQGKNFIKVESKGDHVLLSIV